MNQKIQVCRVCQNRAFNPETGVNCGLTNQKPTFEENCADFNKDEAALKEILEREQRIRESEEHSGGSFAYEKKGLSMGVAGGVLMMLIAVVWFVGGYMAGYIFYYPPVLFIIGIVGVIKGLATGNMTGEKN